MARMFATGRRALAICDRCGFQIRYRELRAEYSDGHTTGMKVCSACWDPDVPEDPPMVIDAEQLRDPRSDFREREVSRRTLGKIDLDSYFLGPMLSQELAVTFGQLDVKVVVTGRLTGVGAELRGEIASQATIEANLLVPNPFMEADLVATGTIEGTLTGVAAELAAEVTGSGTIDAALSGISAQLGANLAGSGAISGKITGSAADLGTEIATSSFVSGGLTGSAAALGANLTASATVEGPLDEVAPAWTALFDFTDISTLFADTAGTTPVFTDGDRVGRAVDSLAGSLYMSSTPGGDGTRFFYSTATGGSTMRTDGFKWFGDPGWLDGALNGTDAWFATMTILVTAEAGEAWLLTKTHVASPASGITADIIMSGSPSQFVLTRTVAGTDSTVTLDLPDILDGPMVLSFGYDGTDLFARLNLDTPETQTASGSLPSASVDGYATFGGGDGLLHYYAFGFIDSFPTGAAQDALIAEAGAYAGLVFGGGD